MRCHFAQTRTAILKKKKNVEPSHIPGRIIKWWKTIWLFLKKLNAELTYDPAIPLLSIYPKTTENRYSSKYFSHMFIATLFTIAKR